MTKIKKFLYFIGFLWLCLMICLEIKTSNELFDLLAFISMASFCCWRSFREDNPKIFYFIMFLFVIGGSFYTLTQNKPIGLICLIASGRSLFGYLKAERERCKQPSNQ